MYRIEEWKRDHTDGRVRIEWIGRLGEGRLWTVRLDDVWATAETEGPDLEDCWERATHLHGIRSTRSVEESAPTERRAIDRAGSTERAATDPESDGRARKVEPDEDNDGEESDEA
jgi:hypothetical protein